jgi:sugar lactone lactonase YvrE
MRSGLPCGPSRAAALACLALAACKEGSENNATASFVPIQPAPDGTQGCAGPNQVLVPKMAVFADPILGPTSQLAAAAAETFYVTGADGSVTELDFSSGAPPVVTTLVAGGVGGPIDQLLASVGIAQPSELSGIALLDAASLAVVEHTSNTLLLVDRTTPDAVSFLAGFPDVVEGFNDGLAGQARFSFPAGIATGILASSDGRIFVADVGNHAIRQLSIGPPITVTTVTGRGVPFFNDGELAMAAFDSPAGLTVTCGGELVVAELGSFGLGGNRLRSLAIGTPDFFGGFRGTASTLVAGLDAPRGVVTSASGEAYWVDSGAGILRRYDFGLGTDDCPLFPDCTSALATFTAGAAVSLAISEAGMLYALDGDAGTLYRIST